MPSQQQNYETWNNSYDWSRYGGDEWSARWGGTDMQWYWCLLPRISRHLPVDTILEIGPGYGRWTKYLRAHCRQLVLVDISERCIHACRGRFGEENMIYRVGTGDSLDFLEDHSIDFAFSWETLTYVEEEGIKNYLGDLSLKLREEGKAFLHHSNIGAYKSYFDRTLKLPKTWRDKLKKKGLLDYDQWRARSVTAESFAASALAVDLHPWSQELIPWGGRRLIDGLTTLGKKPPRKPCQVLRNPDFHKQAYEIQKLSWLYGEGVPW